jgi:hypothetical protein
VRNKLPVVIPRGLHPTHKPGLHFALTPDYITVVELAFFASPLLYHSLPTRRTVTGADGRRYSVADTSVRSFAYGAPPARRNTIAVVSNEHAQADKNSFKSHPDQAIYSRNSWENTPAYRKGGAMSKVVRSVKNVTKGYSSVQVKVRNGTEGTHFNGSWVLTVTSDLQ